MPEPFPSRPRGGGAILAFAILAGIAAGALLGEPTIGFLAGTGIGLALMALLWLLDRKRG